jgi:hypothetical protein
MRFEVECRLPSRPPEATRRCGRRWLAKCGAVQTGPRAAPAPWIRNFPEGRGFACVLAQRPAQLSSCRNSERPITPCVGFLRGVRLQITPPLRKQVRGILIIFADHLHSQPILGDDGGDHASIGTLRSVFRCRRHASCVATGSEFDLFGRRSSAAFVSPNSSAISASDLSRRRTQPGVDGAKREAKDTP